MRIRDMLASKFDLRAKIARLKEENAQIRARLTNREIALREEQEKSTHYYRLITESQEIKETVFATQRENLARLADARKTIKQYEKLFAELYGKLCAFEGLE